MAMNERPGVYSSYEVTSSVSGAGTGGVLGCAAIGEKGAALGVTRIASRAAAAAAFGEGGITELISLALRNGAGAVYARCLASGAQAADYAAAFAELAETEGISAVLCDSRAAAVHAALKESILSAGEASRYRIGVAEVAGTTAEKIAAAAAVNCERMVLVAADENNAAGAVAAALSGVMAATADPALPLNGAELLGVTAPTYWSDDEVNSLVRGGVTLTESAAGSPCVLRAVTSRTTTGGAADSTWREVTTVRIIDELIPGIRAALRARFARAKNTAQTRGAIRTQVVIELEDRLAREIIDSYGDVTVAPAADDPTTCEVQFEFTVAHGLNHISLAAKITV